MKKPTQYQLYQRARDQAAEMDRLFLDMVRQGMTRRELETNIKRRPAVWSRYAGFINKLR
jgi:hypothetical protein